MLDHQRASRMLVQPSIEAKHIILKDDDGVAVGNHAFDNPRREDLITVHGCDEKRSSESNINEHTKRERYRLLEENRYLRLVSRKRRVNWSGPRLMHEGRNEIIMLVKKSK